MLFSFCDPTLDPAGPTVDNSKIMNMFEESPKDYEYVPRESKTKFNFISEFLIR